MTVRGPAIRTPAEVAAIDRACRVCAQVLDAALSHVSIGLTPRDLDAIVAIELRARAADPIAREVEPAHEGACAIAVNHETGPHSPGDRPFEPGDIINIDLPLRHRGWCADMAISCALGETTASTSLARASSAAFSTLLHVARPGRLWSAVARDVRLAVAAHHAALVPGWAGHAIGQSLHEGQPIPLTGLDGADIPSSLDFTLRPGQVFTFEPVLRAAAALSDPPGPVCMPEAIVCITPEGVTLLGGVTGPDAYFRILQPETRPRAG